MPFTYRDYPVREVALAIQDRQPLASGHERMQTGDIIAIRKPSRGVGKKEASQYLWLRIQGPDTNELDKLKGMLDETGTEDDPGIEFDKRRYCIPLNRLPGFVDTARVQDPTDIYQPFLPLDEDSLLYLEGSQRKPFRVEGLVFDKLTGRFL